MEEQIATTPKKTTRTRKTATTSELVSAETSPTSSTVTQVFDDLMSKFIQTKGEFDNLQKEITQMKMDWAREQKQHEVDVDQRKTQEELERKREEETYQYSVNLARKRSEDEFQDKKLVWEKELSGKKDELAKEKQELEQLRKLVADFDSQKEQAVKEAQNLVEKELTEQFENQTKLREQEVKAEKEVLGLKISNLEVENARLTKEMEILKRSFDEATKQVKEIAVKVIESGSTQAKPQVSPQE